MERVLFCHVYMMNTWPSIIAFDSRNEVYNAINFWYSSCTFFCFQWEEQAAQQAAMQFQVEADVMDHDDYHIMLWYLVNRKLTQP